MKRIALMVIVGIFLASCQTTGVKADSPKNTVRLEKYGIEFTLPDRWKIATERKEDRILKATDKHEEANINLYIVKEDEKKSLDEWMQEQIPEQLGRWSKHNAYSIRFTERKKITTASGKIVDVKYHSINLETGKGDRRRETAFVYFSHSDFYFYLFVYNKRGRSGYRRSIDKEIEEIILLGIKFL